MESVRIPFSGNTSEEDVSVRHRVLFALAGALHVSAGFLQNAISHSTPDQNTLEFRLHYLRKEMKKERELLASCFASGVTGKELQKPHDAFDRLMEEYPQVKQALVEQKDLAED